jgi:hypothetical protein
VLAQRTAAHCTMINDYNISWLRSYP